MTNVQMLTGLVNRLVLFLLVFAGIYVSVTSIATAIADVSGKDGTDLDAIVLGLVALVVVINMSIGGHFLTKWSTTGWQVLVAITPLFIAFGAIAVQFTPWGVILIAASAPSLLILLQPAKIDRWTRAVLGIDDGARLASVLGASGAVMLIIFDTFSFAPCPYTYQSILIALLAAGFYLVAHGFLIRARGRREESPIQAPRHVADVHPAIATTAFFSLFSWALCPVIIILATKQLAVLSSFGSAFSTVWVAILSLIALAGGAGAVVLLATRARHPKPIQVAALVFLGILGACTAAITLASEILDGNAILAIRLLMFFSIPGTFLAMLGIQAPDVKGIAFHFLKGFMTVVSIILLIVGIGIKINVPDVDMYFMAVYLVTFALAAVATAIPLVASKNKVEVQVP